MSKYTNKVRAGLLSALLTAASVAGVASSAAAEPVILPDAAGPEVSSALPEASWLDSYFSEALGTATPIGTAASGRWIEYNLSNYCVTLHDGGSVAYQDCTTSSGKKSTPTPTGTFRVQRKAVGPICMHPPGDKEVCGIHYATYFTKSGAAFHEAWWNKSWNQRVSHGCVNMTLGGAKTVFNFASPGMTVKVHW